MKSKAVRWIRSGYGILFMAWAAMIAAWSASAAIPVYTITVSGLPVTGAWGATYDITVTYSYAWSDSNDKPEDGATITLLEVDPSSGSDIYATRELPAPANGDNNSGTWSGSVLFKSVNLMTAMDDDADDRDGTLEIKGRFKEHSPIQDYNRDSTVYTVKAPPGTPTFVTVPAKSESGEFSVNWGLSYGALEYEIQRKTDSLGIWATRYMGNVFSYDDKCSRGHVYYYRVRGFGAGGYGAWRTATNGCLVPLIPPQFILVPATDDDGAYTIVWGTSPGASGYELQEKIDGGSFWLSVYTGAGLSKTLSGRLRDRTYTYRVCGLQGSSSLRSDWKNGSNGVRILNPGVLAFKSGSAVVGEGTSPVSLIVTRSGGTAGSATVKYATLDKTALAGQDYKARTGTLSWSDGDATDKTINVRILDDALTESNEVFKVRLSDATGATLGAPRVAKVKITANAKGADAGAAPVVPLAQALDNDALAWATGNSAPWTGQGGVSAGGDAAALSGARAGEGISWLETSVSGPGVLEFDWRLATDQAADTLILMDNGTVLAAITGFTEWDRLSLALPGGPHTLRWTFIGSVDGAEPAGAGCLDRVRLTSAP